MTQPDTTHARADREPTGGPECADPTTLPPARLAAMLRAWSAGLYPSEAATELLIAHGTWLHRPDFLLTLVDAVEDGWGRGGHIVPMASVDWDRVETFLAHTYGSTSELNVLRLAASLAGATTTGSLLDMTSGLDDTNTRYVLDALAHRFGWHEHGTTHTTTGQLTRTDATRSPS